MATYIHELFLQLVRLGIGHTGNAHTQENERLCFIDWETLKALADEQGLSAVVLDGIEKLNTNDTNSLSIAMKLEWIGEVLQNYEQRYSLYESAISSLVGFYKQHGYRMMVLKGYACSLDWPIPNHRPCGDIDIWQFGDQKEADDVLIRVKGILIDNSHHHHTVFSWNGFTVENHYDFIEVHYRKSSLTLEKILKEQGADDTHFVEVNGERAYLPSSNLHALFLSRHALEHFASENVTIRHLLDWAFFVKTQGKYVDWKWLHRVLEQFGMLPIFSIFNAICIEDLGFDASLFPEAEVDSQIKQRVLNEILNPEFNEIQPKGLLPRVAFKYRRWKTNGWKHQLCYKESRWSAFWSGTWNHILKPSSI